MFTIDIEYIHVAFSSHYLLLYGDRRLTQELPYLPTYLPTCWGKKEIRVYHLLSSTGVLFQLIRVITSTSR